MGVTIELRVFHWLGSGNVCAPTFQGDETSLTKLFITG
jgi:hypothetical protein